GDAAVVVTKRSGRSLPAEPVRVLRSCVGGDAAVRPLADDEQQVVIIHEHQRPLLDRGLVPMGYLLTNGSQLFLKLRVETLPHVPGSSFHRVRTPATIAPTGNLIHSAPFSMVPEACESLRMNRLRGRMWGLPGGICQSAGGG